MKSNILRTEIPEHLRPLPVIKFCTYRRYRPEYFNPEALLTLCGKVVDNTPLPEWTLEEVAEWVAAELNYPEFKEAFTDNAIKRRLLVLLEADKFPRIGIKNLEDIKKITSVIRELCKLDQEEFSRSKTLPIRRPQTLYLQYRATKDCEEDLLSPSEYFRKINIIRDETTEDRRYASSNHWNKIPPYRPYCPHVTVGNIRRINPMTGTTQRQIFNIKDKFYLLKDLCIYPSDFCKEKKILQKFNFSRRIRNKENKT